MQSPPGKALQRMGCTPTKGRNLTKPSHLFQKVVLKESIVCMALSEDRSLLVTGSSNGVVFMWSTMSKPVERLAELAGHKDSVTCCAIYDCYIITGSADSTIIRWDIASAEQLQVYSGHTSKINRILCAGNFLFSSSYDKTARAWYLETGSEAESEPPDDVLPNGNNENENGNQSGQDTSGAHICTFQGHKKGVYPIAFIPAENNTLVTGEICERDVVITGSVDSTARIWSLATSECLKVLGGHSAPIHCIAVDPLNTRHIFTAGGDSVIICWDVVTGDRLRLLRGHEGTVLCLVVHNRMLYSGGADKTARAWVMEFGEETRTFSGSRGPVTCVQFYNGMVYTGSADGSSRIFDAKSGTLKRTFKGHQQPITAILVAPGRTFTSCVEGNLCVWDSGGVTEETVFGNKPISEEVESDDDCDRVKEAIQVLDPYIRH